MRYRTLAVLATPLLFLSYVLSEAAFADVSVGAGVNLDEGGVRDFHLAIGSHFGVKETSVRAALRRKISDEDLPVVFFLARKAKVSPETVVDLRLSGKSWMAMTIHFGLSAEVFHVHVVGSHGPPYGRALGHYKKDRSQWATIRLVDADVVQLVNLKFLAAHHGYSSDEVIRMHKKGESFLTLNMNVKTHKKATKVKQIGEKKSHPAKTHPKKNHAKKHKEAKHSDRHDRARSSGGKGRGRGGKR